MEGRKIQDSAIYLQRKYNHLEGQDKHHTEKEMEETDGAHTLVREKWKNHENIMQLEYKAAK